MQRLLAWIKESASRVQIPITAVCVHFILMPSNINLYLLLPAMSEIARQTRLSNHGRKTNLGE